MQCQAKNIKITVTVQGEPYELETYEGEYRNLMQLIYDKIYIEEFGECKGVGRCGTCHIYVLEPTCFAAADGVEPTTLSRVSQVKENSRLACQIMIDARLNNSKVEVAESMAESSY